MEQLVVHVHLMAVNVLVEVIIDLINNMSNNDPKQACTDELLLLDYCQGFKCLSVLKCWEPFLRCVPHWPRFQLFSAWDNRRNGFITEHNTWVLFNMIVVKVLIVVWFYAEHCVFSLCNLLKQPVRDEHEHPAVNHFWTVQQMIVHSH